MVAKPNPSFMRREALRDALLNSMELLRKRRACDIPDGYIDDYVALNWLEWNGGSLRLTTTGDNVCQQLMQEARLTGAPPA